MLRTFLTLTASLGLLSGAAQAEPLEDREIRAHVAGAKFIGINKLYKSPYSFQFSANGAMKGVIGKKNQWDDRGRWWAKGDKLCMHWELWSMGKPVCYGIDLNGDQISRLKGDGSVFQKSTLVR